ncbi:PA2169 family four-helix-bundle protein [Pedobacter gandavensis]|uniref:ferritin-like domain-containing protein n=1 Tax=Pedobacter gandavensis TaxID=2679963 RepID=UPI00292F9AAD|nr:PA2169 family four-helix-bundle protein [Pedobacter gandavensis]
MENKAINTEILNDLIQINNDRVLGYEKALSELSDADSDLRSLFSEMIRQSKQHKAALTQEVQVLGSDAETSGTTTSGKIYRAWMDVKAIFTGHDPETVLNNCEFGEDAAQKAYKMAIDTEGLSANLKSIISTQKADLYNSHNQIKALRDQVSS